MSNFSPSLTPLSSVEACVPPYYLDTEQLCPCAILFTRFPIVKILLVRILHLKQLASAPSFVVQAWSKCAFLVSLQANAAREIEVRQKKELKKLQQMDLSQYSIKGSELEWKDALVQPGKQLVSIKRCVHGQPSSRSFFTCKTKSYAALPSHVGIIYHTCSHNERTALFQSEESRFLDLLHS